MNPPPANVFNAFANADLGANPEAAAYDIQPASIASAVDFNPNAKASSTDPIVDASGTAIPIDGLAQ